jgi:hypothetical protein
VISQAQNYVGFRSHDSFLTSPHILQTFQVVELVEFPYKSQEALHQTLNSVGLQRLGSIERA